MAQSKADKKTAEPDFEKSLAELEKLVTRLEEGDLSLEDSLKQFERGIELTRSCQTALKNAELRVKKLGLQNGRPEESDFEGDDDN